MTCKLCETVYYGGLAWISGDPPVCAFDDGVKNVMSGRFQPNNWNCATMNKLRDLVEEKSEGGYASAYRDRYDDCSIGVLQAPDGWHLVMTWYKERGCTGDAFLVRDGEHMTLTEKIAESIIKMYE